MDEEDGNGELYGCGDGDGGTEGINYGQGGVGIPVPLTLLTLLRLAGMRVVGRRVAIGWRGGRKWVGTGSLAKDPTCYGDATTTHAPCAT